MHISLKSEGCRGFLENLNDSFIAPFETPLPAITVNVVASL